MKCVGEKTKTFSLSAGRLLGFRNLMPDGNASLDQQAKELFNKRGTETDRKEADGSCPLIA